MPPSASKTDENKTWDEENQWNREKNRNIEHTIYKRKYTGNMYIMARLSSSDVGQYIFRVPPKNITREIQLLVFLMLI